MGAYGSYCNRQLIMTRNRPGVLSDASAHGNYSESERPSPLAVEGYLASQGGSEVTYWTYFASVVIAISSASVKGTKGRWAIKYERGGTEMK
jgi:hypothetical protein